MTKITTTTKKLNQVIDEILNEITGAKPPLQMLSENKASHTSNPQYGLLACPPSYSPSVQMLKGIIKEEVSKIEFIKEVGDKINQLAFQGGVADEFKNKVMELNRRLTMNNLGGYAGWEITNDRQQAIFALGLVPDYYPEMMTSVEKYVDGAGFIYRWGSDHEREELAHTSPALWKQIDDLFPDWWRDEYDEVDVGDVVSQPKKKTSSSSSQIPAEFQRAENELIARVNADLLDDRKKN